MLVAVASAACTISTDDERPDPFPGGGRAGTGGGASLPGPSDIGAGNSPSALGGRATGVSGNTFVTDAGRDTRGGAPGSGVAGAFSAGTPSSGGSDFFGVAGSANPFGAGPGTRFAGSGAF